MFNFKRFGKIAKLAKSIKVNFEILRYCNYRYITYNDYITIKI